MSAGENPRAIRDDPKTTTGSAFSPFRHPAFTVIWTASVAANIGTWMYTAASGWLMTSLAPDPLTVSLVQVAATLPIFLIAIPAGALADIVDRPAAPTRRVFAVTRADHAAVGSPLGEGEKEHALCFDHCDVALVSTSCPRRAS